MRAQCRETPQHSRGTDRQSRGAGAAIGSDLSADRMKFSRGQRGEGTVAAMQESSGLRKNYVWEQQPAKQGHSRQGENDG